MNVHKDLEEAELNYKTLLLNVTNKRKTKPRDISNLIGYTLRMKLQSIEAKKVNLKDTIPLDMDNNDCATVGLNECGISYKELVDRSQFVSERINRFSRASKYLN